MSNDSLSVSLLAFIAGAIFGACMAMLSDRKSVTIINQPDVSVAEETELDDPENWWKHGGPKE